MIDRAADQERGDPGRIVRVAAAAGPLGAPASFWFLAYTLALSAACLLFPPGRWMGGIVTAFSLTEFAAVCVALRFYRPAQPASWRLMALGVGFYAAASSVWYGWYPIVMGQSAPLVSFADGLYGGAYLCFIAGLTILVRRRGGADGSVGSLIDAAIVSTGVGVFAWVYLLEPLGAAANGSPVGRAVSLSYPILDLALVAMLAGAMFTRGTRPPAFWLLCGFVSTLLATDFAYTLALIDNTWEPGRSLAVGWLVAGGCLAAAALHPSMRTVGEADGRAGGSGMSWRRLAFLAAAAAVVPGGQLVGLRHHTNEVLVGSTLIFGLCLARMGVLTRELSRAAHALRRNDRDLRSTVEQLAEARDEAVTASHMKSEFLANMSHEIRTPMNGVLGMTSLLLGTELEHEQRGFAETVLASGEALLDILNDILDFSKIEAGRLDLECIDFDLRAMVEGVATLLGPAAHPKGLELVCDLPDDLPQTVRGDPGRLRQILTNLIGNAVKFTAFGEVVLKLTSADKDGGGVVIRFEVIDTGIGIAKDDQTAMFESFAQADASTTRRYGGTGLGLAISRQLVHLMGGEIGVRSELGHGSNFWCTVPFHMVGPALPTAPRAELAGRRMLVVDDNATNRAILTRFLQAWGIQTESADGATAALEAVAASDAEGHPFDAFLLDLNMPEVDGIELARRMASGEDRPLRMVLLTSSMLGGEQAAAREAGITRCLAKPVHQAQLQDCLAIMMATLQATTQFQAVSSPPSPTEGHHHRVLLAEDNLVNQRVGLAMLQKLGFDVDLVSNGAEAVDASTSSPYEAILMDCQMPVMDGYEATTEIRSREGATTHVPIIAVTASAMQSDGERCRAAGMDDYLTKPLSMNALDAVLARWTGQADGPTPPINGPPLLTGRR